LPKLSRRSFIALTGSTAATTACPAFAAVSHAPTFDYVLKGGRIFDGTGAAEAAGDIGIRGDSIVAIGSIDAGQARQVLDVRGLCVAPGFIDIHTHSDGEILRYGDDESRIFQGVTTEVTGNCGYSAAPYVDAESAQLRRDLAAAGVTQTWTDVGSYFRLLQSNHCATNQVMLLGQGTLRQTIAGLENRPLSPAELQQAVRGLETALDQGAAGMSSGLEYTPGRYTPTDELLALARVLQRRGKLYASHIRNEESGLLEAIDEALRIGRETGVRVQVSHLKAAGKANWPKQDAAIAALERARAAGVDVLADVYPYTAYSTGLTVFLSDATQEGGFGPMLTRFADPAERARIRAALDPRIANDPGAYELIVISATVAANQSEVVGRDLATIARDRRVEPAEALLQLLEEACSEVSFVGHGMSEENVVRVLTHPMLMVSSDGYAMAPRGDALLSRPHPRSYGAFARVLAHYVREERKLDLATAVHKMSGMPAAQLRLDDRGTLAKGKRADVVVFDAATVKDVSGFAEPHKLSTGFAHVLVNGVPVIRDQRATGARPGRVLS
jgi:N-acyl-D-amino-acid deacylase